MTIPKNILHFFYLLKSATAWLRIFYYFLLASLALIGYQYFNSGLNLWWVWSILLLSQISLGPTLEKRMLIMSLTGLISGLIIFILNFFNHFFPLGTLIAFILLSISSYLGLHNRTYFLAFFSFNLLLILSIGEHLPLEDNLIRCCFIWGGTFIAVVGQLIFWPNFKRREIKWHSQLVLTELQDLTDIIFTYFLNPANFENPYFYERKLHQKKNQTMFVLNYFQKICQHFNNLKQLSECFMGIFASLIECAQLRRRVTDYTIFSLCVPEMSTLAESLNGLFESLKQSHHVDLENLNLNIDYFDDQFHQVMQVTSREPLVFLLFIQSLRDLSTILTTLNEEFIGAIYEK